jgi:hypothetical protein
MVILLIFFLVNNSDLRHQLIAIIQYSSFYAFHGVWVLPWGTEETYRTRELVSDGKEKFRGDGVITLAYTGKIPVQNLSIQKSRPSMSCL